MLGAMDDKKKKEMKKEADALEKILKDVEKRVDKLIKLTGSDMVFINMLKYMSMLQKKQHEQIQSIIKNLR